MDEERWVWIFWISCGVDCGFPALPVVWIVDFGEFLLFVFSISDFPILDCSIFSI